MTGGEWRACLSMVDSVRSIGSRKKTKLVIEGALYKAALAGGLDLDCESTKERLRCYFNFALMLDRSGMLNETR